MQTVLVVDDEENTRQMLRMLLEFHNFRVEEAEDGLDALAKIRQKCPDVLLLDVMMPNMDGISLCKLLRNEPTTAQLPIIMFSGKTHLGAPEEGLAVGANVYLNKPVKSKTLLEHIRVLLVEPAAH
jgi:DNA-binding response OmpR family regulator